MRVKTHHEVDRARDKTASRRSMRDRMKLKQEEFISHTEQYTLNMKEKVEDA